MVTTCGIFLLNKNNQILLVHPSNDPKNIWSIPKGMMETGETYIETALRETFEETNIKLDINSSKILKIFEFDMIKYKKTKKQLKSFLIINLEHFLVNHEVELMKNLDVFGIPQETI